RLAGAEQVLAFTRVLLLTEAPVAGLLRQRRFEERVESAQRGQGRRGGAGIVCSLRLRHSISERLVDELNVPLVFLPRHTIPDLRRVDQIRLRLLEERWNLFQPLDDVPEPLLLRRVV